MHKQILLCLGCAVGYMSTFKNYCDQKGLDFDSYWGQDATSELYHFIGKDIVYFQACFGLLCSKALTSANQAKFLFMVTPLLMALRCQNLRGLLFKQEPT